MPKNIDETANNVAGATHRKTQKMRFRMNRVMAFCLVANGAVSGLVFDDNIGSSYTDEAVCGNDQKDSVWNEVREALKRRGEEDIEREKYNAAVLAGLTGKVVMGAPGEKRAMAQLAEMRAGGYRTGRTKGGA